MGDTNICAYVHTNVGEIRRVNPHPTLVKLGRKLSPAATWSEAELSMDHFH
ncbi:hypothetical protein H4R33_002152 [Dimargaris cristalligena]|nr:hypothetical protein H4R33_002152 [Dimargaris cristalligena]